MDSKRSMFGARCSVLGARRAFCVLKGVPARLAKFVSFVIVWSVLASCGNELSAGATLHTNVNGKSVSLPAKDVFGRSRIGKRALIVSLPCASCFDPSSWTKHVADAGKGQIILVSKEETAKSDYAFLAKKPNTRLIIDRSADLVPREALDYPPVAMWCDAAGKVIEPEARREAIEGFIIRFTPRSREASK